MTARTSNVNCRSLQDDKKGTYNGIGIGEGEGKGKARAGGPISKVVRVFRQVLREGGC
jgi:hypothetical protein